MGSAGHSRTLGDRSLWYDELWTVGMASPLTSFEEAIDSIRGDVHPPLYYFGLKAWLTALRSSSEWAARSFNVLALATALLGALWAKQNRIAAPLGLWFGLFFSSFGLLWYLQEARMYAFLICHSFLTCVFALVYEQVRQRLPTCSFVALTTIVFLVLPFVHWFAGLFSGLVLLSLFVMSCVERRVSYALLFLCVGLAFTAFVTAWILENWQSTMGQMGQYGGGQGIVRWGLRRLFVGILLFAFALNPIQILCATFGLYSTLKSPRRPGPLIIVICSVLGTLIILAVSIRTPMYWTRNFTWFVAPASLLTAIGLERIAELLRLRQWQAAALSVTLALNLLSGRFADRVYGLERDEWREAGAFVLAQPGCAAAPIPAVIQWLSRSARPYVIAGQRRIYGYYGGGADHIVPVYREDHALPKLAQGDVCPVLLWIGQMTREDAQAQATDLLGPMVGTVRVVHFPGNTLFLRPD